MIIAHRGDSAHAPENTLDAALLGHKAGADAWELDVRLTRDGVPVVLHDASLLRTTNVLQRFPDDPRGAAGYRLADFDHDEVRTLDAGSWFLSRQLGKPRTALSFGTRDQLDRHQVARFASGEVRIPTLLECLILTEQLDWIVNVEIKSCPILDDRLFPAVIDAIESAGAGMIDRVLLSSFDHTVVARAARRPRRPATGVLAKVPLDNPAHYVHEVIGADCFHPSVLALEATPDLAALKETGVPVLTYTVNDSSRGARLLQAGVTGLFTDDPRLFLQD
ncbi:MAG: glycerophosphodiester phosphodiesterase family protein [Isosphaeraceae bacterium]